MAEPIVVPSAATAAAGQTQVPPPLTLAMLTFAGKPALATRICPAPVAATVMEHVVPEHAAFDAFWMKVALPPEVPPPLPFESVTEVTLLVVSFQPTTTMFILPAVWLLGNATETVCALEGVADFTWTNLGTL